MEKEMVHCVVIKPDLKIWDGNKYQFVTIGDDVGLPKGIARIEAKAGFVRIVGTEPKQEEESGNSPQ